MKWMWLQLWQIKDDFFVISFFLLSELEYVHVLRLLNRSIIKFLLCV